MNSTARCFGSLASLPKFQVSGVGTREEGSTFSFRRPVGALKYYATVIDFETIVKDLSATDPIRLGSMMAGLSIGSSSTVGHQSLADMVCPWTSDYMTQHLTILPLHYRSKLFHFSH